MSRPAALFESALDGARGMVNGRLSVTQNGTAVTCAVKTLLNNDPSVGDPVFFVFSDGVGGYAVDMVTAALSFTFSSGSTAGFISGTAPARIWWFAVEDGGTVRIGGINCYASGGIAALDENVPISSVVDDGGSGHANTGGKFYTGTAVSAKYIRVLGHSEWDSGLATAGTWNANPSRTILHQPGAKLPGAVVQSPAPGTRTTQDAYLSTSYMVTLVTVSITPTSKHNIISVVAYGAIMVEAAADAGAAVIQRGGVNVCTSIDVFHAGINSSGPLFGFYNTPLTLIGGDAPASTSSQTYAVYVKGASTSAGHQIIFPHVNSGEGGASIFASEIVA